MRRLASLRRERRSRRSSFSRINSSGRFKLTLLWGPQLRSLRPFTLSGFGANGAVLTAFTIAHTRS